MSDQHDLRADADVSPEEEEIIEGEFLPDDDTHLLGDIAEEVVPSTSPTPDSDETIASSEAATDTAAPEIIWQRTRQKSANRLAIFPLAMGLIGLGGLLLAEDYVDGLEVSLGASTIIIIGALILTYLFRFFTSGRRERGLFFLAIITISWGGLLALSVIDDENFPLDEFWPLAFAGVGAAFFMTFLFERSHQAGLVFPGIILLFTAGVAFLVTLDIINDDAQDIIADYWPLLLAFIGLTLLPSALQEEL